MFLQGILIGLAIAVPVGPIGFLCLRRTLVYGRLTGFVSGLGAATADAIFGAVAALGLTAVSTFLLGLERWLQLGAGVFLVLIGWRTIRARPPLAATEATAMPPQRSLSAAFLSTLVLTAANPATILAFIAIFAGVGIHVAGGTYAAVSLVGGVFAGSSLWWLGLAYSAGAIFRRLEGGSIRVLHVVSGSCIVALGLWQLAQAAALVKVW